MSFSSPGENSWNHFTRLRKKPFEFDWFGHCQVIKIGSYVILYVITESAQIYQIIFFFTIDTILKSIGELFSSRTGYHLFVRLRRETRKVGELIRLFLDSIPEWDPINKSCRTVLELRVKHVPIWVTSFTVSKPFPNYTVCVMVITWTVTTSAF